MTTKTIKTTTQKNPITIRNWESSQDYKLFDILGSLYGQTYRINNRISANDAKIWLEAQPGFDPQRMIFILEQNQIPFALLSFYPLQTKQCDMIFRIWMDIHPEWTRSSVIAKALKNIEEQITQIAREMNLQNARMECIYHDKEKWRQQVLEARGFESQDYYFEMHKTIQPHPEKIEVPANITLKPADSIQKEITCLQFQALSVQEQIGYTLSENRFIDAVRQQEHYNPYLWKVAWQADKLVGFANNYIDEKENHYLERKCGYIEKLSIDEKYKQTKLPHLLLMESIKMFSEMGIEEVITNFDIINEKDELDIFESFGFQAKKYIVGMKKKIEI